MYQPTLKANLSPWIVSWSRLELNCPIINTTNAKRFNQLPEKALVTIINSKLVFMLYFAVLFLFGFFVAFYLYICILFHSVCSVLSHSYLQKHFYNMDNYYLAKLACTMYIISKKCRHSKRNVVCNKSLWKLWIKIWIKKVSTFNLLYICI